MNKTLISDAVVCIHEDRLSHLVGLRLAVLSLQAHCPKLEIIVSCPNPPQSLFNWISGLTNIKLKSFPELGKVGWNIKPALLLKLLHSGYTNVIWLDSDVIVNGNILELIANYDADVLVATEEPYWGQLQGGSFRTTAWGLSFARAFDCTINTGVIRATSHHIILLEAWQTMLNHPIYLKVQSLPAFERPLHMVGDQEVLTALMCSTEFEDITVVLLERGRVIAQCFGAAGFTPLERLKNIVQFNAPALFHAMGEKPWTKDIRPPKLLNKDQKILYNLRRYYEYVTLELSPYTVIARKYQKVESENTWMNTNSNLAKMCFFLGFGSPNLIGFPLAIIDSVTKFIRSHLKIGRYSTSSEYRLSESPLSITKNKQSEAA